MKEKDEQESREGRKTVAHLARRAIDAFKADARADYDELVKTYEGRSAVVGVFGLGSVTIAVSGGEVHVDSPDRAKETKLIGRGATYPETILALAEARMTPLEAFHTGDLVVRAPSDDLHTAYGLMVKMSDSAIKSPGLQEVLKEFRGVTEER